MFFPIPRTLVEVAMSRQLFDVVEPMLQSLPKEIANVPAFIERYKAYSLRRWVLKDGWKTKEPRLILATLYDHLHSQDSESMLLKAAAQVSGVIFLFPLLFFPFFFQPKKNALLTLL